MRRIPDQAKMIRYPSAMKRSPLYEQEDDDDRFDAGNDPARARNVGKGYPIKGI